MRCLVFLQAGKYFFFIENSTVGFFSLACGTWASSDWGQWPLPEEVYLQQSAIGGCPRVSREEHEKWIICIKKKTIFFSTPTTISSFQWLSLSFYMWSQKMKIKGKIILDTKLISIWLYYKCWSIKNLHFIPETYLSEVFIKYLSYPNMYIFIL